MAKKIKTETVAPKIAAAPGITPAATAPNTPLMLNFRFQAAVIALIAFLFYCNTFSHENALDDRMVITDNEYVQQGFAGIPHILTSDAYESYAAKQHSANMLTGGRYRPLSIVTFAIEQQFLGIADRAPQEHTGQPRSTMLTDAEKEKIIADMHPRHVINVLLYMLSLVVLLSFLRKVVFPAAPMAAFAATVLFAILPVHSEVVANVKSRDELLSMLFICLTFIYAFRYQEHKKVNTLVAALGSFFLALLSKEYALTLVVLLPVALYLLKGFNLQKSFTAFLPFLAPLALYGMMRGSAEKGTVDLVNMDIMNAPYLFATASQKLASELYVLLDYLRLLVFPIPMSSDYSYRQLPYRNFGDPLVWCSILAYIGLVLSMIVLFTRRHVLAMGLAFYLLPLLLVCNIFVNIGAPMGERLIYHSSLGFCIVVGYLLATAARKAGTPAKGMMVMAGALGIAVLLCGFATINRNADWKNDRTLFLKDVQTVPNSVMANCNAGAATMDIAAETKDSLLQRAYYLKAITFFNKTIALDSVYVNAYVNRAVCYYKTGNADGALADCDTVRAHSPGQPSLPYMYSVFSNYFFKEGMKYGIAGQHELAIKAFRKAADATPREPETWFNIGFANFSAGHYREALGAWDTLKKIQPNNTRADQYYEQARLGATKQP